jgi:hypothetical protein
MPVYEYKCDKCNIYLELSLPIKDRDNIREISEKYCGLKKYMKENNIHDINLGKPIDCKLKREVSKGTSFKI